MEAERLLYLRVQLVDGRGDVELEHVRAELLQRRGLRDGARAGGGDDLVAALERRGGEPVADP